jgi:uncharacterized membrane protein
MNRNRERILLSSIFLFCFAIRIAFIDQKNLWFDEVFSWNMSMDSFYLILVRTTNDIHPPLFYFILKIWNFLFGDSIFTMRLLSALCASLAIYFIYPICKRFMQPALCLLVIILYSVSPLNLFYSQEVRMSAMNLLFNIGTVYFFIKLLEDRYTLKESLKKPDLYFFLFFQSAALYTHYFSFFILVGEILFLIIQFRKNIKLYYTFILAYFLVFLTYIVWIPTLYEHITRGQSWRPKQNFFQVASEVLNYIKDSSLGLYYYYTNLNLINIITWILLGIILICIVSSFIKKQMSYEINYPLLISLMLIVPVALAVIISFNQKIEFYRYLSILVPYIVICFVYALSKIKFKPIGLTIILLFAAINIFGIYLHYKFDFKNDDYREIIKDINSNYRGGDRIYVEPHYCGWIINYTRKQENLKIPNFIDHRYGFDVLLDSLKTQNPSQFWLVMDYSAVDTSKYSEYVSNLDNTYVKTFSKSYQTAPARVVLYNFRKK